MTRRGFLINLVKGTILVPAASLLGTSVGLSAECKLRDTTEDVEKNLTALNAVFGTTAEATDAFAKRIWQVIRRDINDQMRVGGSLRR